MEYNLDGMTVDDLIGFADKYRGRPERAITEVFGSDEDPKVLRAPEMAQYKIVLGEVVFYAICKALAMTFRASGRVQQALNLEIQLETLYASLPHYARW